MASSFGRRRKWVQYTHIYCISQHVMFCEHTKKIILRRLGVGMKFNALQVVKSKSTFIYSHFSCLLFGFPHECEVQ
jgi:hypothetical protein